MAATSPTPYVPFSRRAEWAGVAPIPQPEAPGGVPPVVPIDYPDECTPWWLACLARYGIAFAWIDFKAIPF